MAEKVIPLIVAGGKGSRFWPLSRGNCPKQFLSIDGGDSLLKRSFLRAQTIAVNAVPYIIAGEDQRELVLSALDGEEGSYQFIGEPFGNNTAAAVYWACKCLKEKEEDGIVAVLPSDHQIPDQEGFSRTLQKAIAVADLKQSIVVIGIMPHYPATGYGYVERGRKEYLEHDSFYHVHRFVEKPHREKARRYLKKGTYHWNSGMSVFPLKAIFDIFDRHLSSFGEKFSDVGVYDREGVYKVYTELENISFDVGILEKEKEIYLVEADFRWDDVGSFNSLGSLITPDEQLNIIKGNPVLKDVRGSVILTDNRLCAVIGMKDVVIVEDNGVLLICPRRRVEEIKEIVASLKDANEQYQ
jgi:mannose-1-phosphate guanylyltransferase